MRYYRTLRSSACLMALLALMIFAHALAGQGQAIAQEPEAPAAGAEPAKAVDLSLYGEAKTVDPDAGSISVQYYDYDNDEERTLSIMVDANTKLENAAALKDIAKDDWVDVVYSVVDGKNVAKSIKVEKEEGEAPGEAAPETSSEEEQL